MRALQVPAVLRRDVRAQALQLQGSWKKGDEKGCSRRLQATARCQQELVVGPYAAPLRICRSACIGIHSPEQHRRAW